jgi:hypothetical protein
MSHRDPRFAACPSVLGRSMGNVRRLWCQLSLIPLVIPLREKVVLDETLNQSRATTDPN